MVAIALLTILVWLALLITAMREMTRMPRLVGRAPAAGDRPLVLAVVPARDEAEVVGTCLKALLAQQNIRLTAVVYDDRSQDGTADVAEVIAHGSSGRLKVLRGTEEPPVGWCGKTHALHQALLMAG
jgi:hypothetical protein